MNAPLQDPMVNEAKKVSSMAWMNWFSTVLSVFKLSVSATTGAATLPANPVGFVSVIINGKEQKIPYYDV